MLAREGGGKLPDAEPSPLTPFRSALRTPEKPRHTESTRPLPRPLGQAGFARLVAEAGRRHPEARGDEGPRLWQATETTRGPAASCLAAPHNESRSLRRLLLLPLSLMRLNLPIQPLAAHPPRPRLQRGRAQTTTTHGPSLTWVAWTKRTREMPTQRQRLMGERVSQRLPPQGVLPRTRISGSCRESPRCGHWLTSIVTRQLQPVAIAFGGR